ncbi:MAG: thioredoxin [Clostridiales bacterium]|nr:thioredoxin [Clostridiales bacterium]
MAYHFNAENFEAEVLKSELPVLVDFFADWCGPCKMIAPVIEALAEEYDGKIKIGKLDAGENQQLALGYGVRNVPAFLFFQNGEIVDRLIGADKKQLEEKCKAFLK